jgi:N-acetyl-anhydromuramyl-L-alanine amidase AmpD
MKINENSHLVIEEGEDFNIRFEKNHNVSAKPQIAERILVIHAPPSKDVNQALQFARDAGRSTHLIIGPDGKEMLQTVPFNVGARHTPGKDGSSIAIELPYAGELSESTAIKIKLKSRYRQDQYILGTPSNGSRYGDWLLFPTAQLESLVKVIAALKKVYTITDVVTREEIISSTVFPAGPAFPILQLRERLIREKLLAKPVGKPRRSLVLQETAGAVHLRGQPDPAGVKLSEILIPRGTPVLVLNERFDWYLIIVMKKVNDNPWLIGWVEKNAVKVSTDFIPVVNEDHFLETSDGKRFQHIEAHKNCFRARPPMEQPDAPKYIIMHYTTGTKLESTINHFTNADPGVATHLVIGRDGRVIQFVPFNLSAHHAGYSWWEMESNLNNSSIGIELDNAGKLTKRKVDGRDVFVSQGDVIIPEGSFKSCSHWRNKKTTPAWETFPPVQLEVALKIVKALKERYPSIKEILGHDQVNLLNREDPGALFPMEEWRKELFGRKSPRIKTFYLSKTTDLISNYNGGLPNESTKLHNPSILPHDSEVIDQGKFDEEAIWTKVKVKQPKQAKALKNQIGWVKTNSLKSEEVRKGKKPPRLKTRINGNQQFYKTRGGQPTPPVPGGPFPAGTRVRKQEENGKWTLVVVQDYIHDQTGFEGWVNAGLVSEKRIPKSSLRIMGVPPGLPLWQHKDDHELGPAAPKRPHPGDPAVFLFEESEAARVDLTKEWQFFILAINYKMPPDKVSAIFGNRKAFCNLTGLGDAAHPRADFIKGENLLSPPPQLDKVRTCALSVMTGFVDSDRKHLIVEMMNGSQPPPLKPGRVQPQRIEEIDPDAYLFTPWSDRYLFFAANRSVRGGRETKPFAHGALYDYTLDGRPYTWLPHVKPARLKVRYPLSRLHRLPPNSEIPSPYKP